MQIYVNSHNNLLDFGMSAHPKVVIAAPHRDILPLRVLVAVARVVVGIGELLRLPVDSLEDPVGVVLLLLGDLRLKELVIVEFPRIYKKMASMQ